MKNLLGRLFKRVASQEDMPSEQASEKTPVEERHKFVSVETEHFQVLLGKQWDERHSDDPEQRVFEHRKLDLGLTISSMGFQDFPDSKISGLANELMRARFEAVQKFSKFTHDPLHVIENEISEMSWGMQVTLLTTSNSGKSMFFVGFVSRKFLVQITLESTTLGLDVMNDEYGKILSSVRMTDDVWEPGHTPPNIPIH